MSDEAKYLEPCPFCGNVPELYDRGDYNVNHSPNCYLALGKPMSQWIVGKSIIAAWNTRVKP
jgi:hypothetical protein